MKGIIYKYTFSDGKVYIGQTRRHPEMRKSEHLDEIVGRTNTGFWEAYQKLGTPEYEELYQTERENEDELVAELNRMETYFIHLYKAHHPEYGYNRTSFGTVVTKTNKIIREKYIEYLNELLDVRMKEYYKAIDKVWKTKEPLTEEEKYLLKEKFREKNIWQEYIDEYDLENLANNEESDTEFLLDEAFHFVHFMIEDEAKDEACQYITENFEKILNEERNKNAIVQIDKNGNAVREFYSFNEICQFFDIPRADNVRNVLKGKQKTAYGYFWKYKKDI